MDINIESRFTQKLGCLQGGALVSSAPTEQNRYSPTESTEPTELLAEDVLPQIAQIYTELLVECVLPQIAQIDTELLAECILPQISQIYTDCLGAFKGVHLSQVHPLKLAGSVNSACSVGEHPQQKVL